MNVLRSPRAIAAIVLALLAAPVFAQDSTRAAPAGAAAASSTSDLELRLAAFTLPSKRTKSTSTTAYDAASPSMTGAEFVIRAIDTGGLRVRYESASASGNGAAGIQFTNLDGRLAIGSRVFDVELGYLLRTETSAAAVKTQLGFPRAGFRSDLNLGSSGITVGFAASYLRQAQAAKDGSLGQGLEGETTGIYVPPMVPFYLQLGFRRQALRFTNQGAKVRSEEMSTVFLGVGFEIGLR